VYCSVDDSTQQQPERKSGGFLFCWPLPVRPGGKNRIPRKIKNVAEVSKVPLKIRNNSRRLKTPAENLNLQPNAGRSAGNLKLQRNN